MKSFSDDYCESAPIIYEEDVKRAKELMERVVHCLDPEFDFDSAFTITPSYDLDRMWELYSHYPSLIDSGLSPDETAYQINTAILRGDIQDEYPLIDGISVTAHNKWNEELAKNLYLLSNNIFQEEPIYFS